MSLILGLLAAAILAFGVVAALAVIVKRPDLGILLIVGNMVMAAQSSSYSVSAGPLTIYVADATCLVLVLAAALTHRSYEVRIKLALPVVVWIALWTLALASGVVLLGLQQAMNEGRGVVYTLAVVVWAWRVFPDKASIERALFKATSVGIIGLGVVSAYHIASYGIGNASELRFDAATNSYVQSRALNSGQSLFLLLSLILRFGERSRVSSLYSPLNLGAVGMIIVAQNRSVWVAALVSLVVLVAMNPRAGKAILGVIALLVGASAIGEIATGAVSDVLRGLSLSLADRGTYDGRVQGWVALLREFGNAGGLPWLIGEPVGSGFRRFQDGQFVEFSPHNWYITTLLRTGGLGLLALLGVLISTARAKNLPRGIPVAITLALAMYFWAYNLEWYVVVFPLWIHMAHGPRRGVSRVAEAYV